MNSAIVKSIDRALLLDHCGIVAAYAASDHCFFSRGLAGLRILQTRGYDGVGFLARTGAGIVHEHKGEGLIDEVFSQDVTDRYHHIRARMWAYQVRYGTNGAFHPQNVQPIAGVHSASGEPFVVVHNGQFSFDAQQETAKKSDTLAFVHQLADSAAGVWDDRIVQALTSAKGAWSLVIGTAEGLYVSRDSFGFRPLVYGHFLDEETKQYVWVCASESSALEKMGVTDFLEILPGTIAKVTNEGMKILSVLPKRRTLGLCIFENVYIHHGGSKVHTVRNSVQKIRSSPSVDDVRQRSGKILAREAPLSKRHVDIVIGIPGTGIEGGMSYARALDLPYFQAITDKASSPLEQRTFMTAKIDGIYEQVLHHFNFDTRALSGKRVVIVDDSIVRGNVTKGLIYLLKHHYAVKSVHVRILCPPVDKPCHLGINTRSPEELIAARHIGDVMGIQQEIDAASLVYLSADGLREAITGNPRARGFCMGCMVGQFHPIDKYGNEIGHRRRVKQDAVDLGPPATDYGKTHAYTRRNVLFTDGEGPLVYKDLAFDLAGRMRIRAGNESSGREFFEILSVYDDFLTEEGKSGYQAGDTLALIVPHLLCHRICDQDVEEEAHDARMVSGVPEYISRLQRDTWDIRVISTAYRPMWNLVGASLEIASEAIACTDMSLDLIRTQVDLSRMLALVTEAEAHVADFQVGFFDDTAQLGELRKILDQLYWKDLPTIGYRPLEVVKVMGGRRKVEAAHRFAKDLGVSLSDVVYIGDSITDDALLSEVKNAGGLAIVVNGNEYALRNAMVAVAATDMRHLLPLLDAWKQGGLASVQAFVLSSGQGTKEVYYALVNREDDQSFRKLLNIHKDFRSRVRGAVAVLG